MGEILTGSRIRQWLLQVAKFYKAAAALGRFRDGQRSIILIREMVLRDIDRGYNEQEVIHSIDWLLTL